MTPPTNITLSRNKKLLTVSFEESDFELSSEYLRVYSPSAEVQGHNPDQAKLQINKEKVIIKTIEPVGHYALRLIFDDGHDTGIYSWSYLREMSEKNIKLYENYLNRVSKISNS